jgi:hypothetical protein
MRLIVGWSFIFWVVDGVLRWIFVSLFELTVDFGSWEEGEMES